MFDIYIPPFVSKALELLNGRGEAFIVGGCVRDSILGNTPNDYDITTSLEPSEIKEVFKDYYQINNNGLKHGTVTVMIDNNLLEVTTYRLDGEYADGRHPDKVTFTKSLEEDLARRDFTINALAYNKTCGLIDYFNGVNDLKIGIIKTVGDPYKRFSEDYLRILRALRFRGRYNFKIEENTKKAINDLAHNLVLISKERINTELHEILLSDSILETLLEYKPVIKAIIPQMEANFDFNQHSKWHKNDVYTHIAYVTSYTKPLFTIRLAALLHDIGKAYCYTEEILDNNLVRHFYGHAEVSHRLATEILNDLRISNDEKKEILYLIKNHDYPLNSKKAIKKLILKTPNESLELIMKLINLKEADSNDHLIQYMDFRALEKEVEEVYNSLSAKSIKDLNINGTDLITLGYSGSIIGKILENVFNEVFNDRLDNNKDKIIDYIKNKQDF